MMDLIKVIVVGTLLFMASPLFAKWSPAYQNQTPSATPAISLSANDLLKLRADFKMEKTGPKQIEAIRSKCFEMSGAVVPLLMEVMKSEEYPDRSRWLATFLLGQIVGSPAAPLLAKYLEHPNWLLRLASMKSLLALEQKEYGPQFVQKLQDPALLVRVQAIENIRQLELGQHADEIWKMLYQKQNYQVVKGKYKRTPVAKLIIRAMGDLQNQSAQAALFSMIKKPNYHDLYADLDYALSKLTHKKSPEGDPTSKRNFWLQIAATAPLPATKSAP